MGYFLKANDIKDYIVKKRRYLHQIPEIGLELENTVKYVKESLISLGLHPIDVGKSGIVVTIGEGKKTVLLRSDMDALPLKEESGLDFAATNGNAHACGHDLHTSYLLGAAKLLKENEKNLNGTVLLMFQPAEETGEGAIDMIDNGLFDIKNVDFAFATHVSSLIAPGNIAVTRGAAMSSSNGFIINITGKGGHGSEPYDAVDPINIGVHIHLALQEIKSREVPFLSNVSLAVGSFNSGFALNIIPHTATLTGTLRTLDKRDQKYIKNRIVELASSIAKAYRGEAEVVFSYNIPAVYNDEASVDLVIKYLSELDGIEFNIVETKPAAGSEDFSYVLEKVPGAIVFIGAGLDEEENFPMHHPKVVFNEDALPIGAAVLAQVATRWLEDNQ